MRVKCTCGTWHDISPTGLAIVIAAFQDGDLTQVTVPERNGVDWGGDIQLNSACLTRAFEDSRVKSFKQRYKGNVISVDSVTL